MPRVLARRAAPSLGATLGRAMGRRLRGRLVTAIVAAGQWGLAAAARAQTTPPAPPPHRIIVFVEQLGGDPSWPRGLLRVLRAHLVDLPVDLRVETVDVHEGHLPIEAAQTIGQRMHAAGVLWVEVRGNHELGFITLDVASSRVLVRNVRTMREDTGLEELADVAHSTVEALLEGREVDWLNPSSAAGASTQEVAPPAAAATVEGEARSATVARGANPLRSPESVVASPAPSADEARTPRVEHLPSRQPSRSWLISAGYVGALLLPRSGASSVWQSGLLLSVGRELGAWGAGLEYQVLDSIEASSPSATIRVVRHPGSAYFGYHATWASFGVWVDGAVGADDSTRRTEAVAAGVEPSADESHWEWLIGARVRSGYAVLPRVWLLLGARVDASLDPPLYKVDRSEVVYEPGRIRPSLEAVLSAGLP